MKRNIVIIDEDKCDGCGLCVDACAEGAIQLVDGKAKLVSEVYCDGLGACLGECPRGAITVEERDAAAFDQTAVDRHLAATRGTDANSVAAGHGQDHGHGHAKPQRPPLGGCPGSMAFAFTQKAKAKSAAGGDAAVPESALEQWPVQLALVPPSAPYLQGADLLVAADCAPFAYAGFHQKLLAGKRLLIACPKLDDVGPYVEKLAMIFAERGVKSVTVARMEVPCCGGIVRVVEAALQKAGVDIPMEVVTIGVNGELKQ